MSEIATLAEEAAGGAPGPADVEHCASLEMSRAAMAEAMAYALIAAADALPDTAD